MAKLVVRIQKRFLSQAATIEKVIGHINQLESLVPMEKLDIAPIKNEPILRYMGGSAELENLERSIESIKQNCQTVPIVINGKEFTQGQEMYQVMPHDHEKRLCKFYHANKQLITYAAKASAIAQAKWDRTDLSYRIKIWERAADLMSNKYRAGLVAATMLGQSKTIYQAEIDAAAELIDFIRINTIFLRDLARYQPVSTYPSVSKNFMRFRGLEGFVAAISPFNFTAIGGNLAYTPALMGNGVVWKPSDNSILSNWCIFNVMREAGVPDGLVNFVPADGPTFGTTIAGLPNLAGINFTGSARAFSSLWKWVGENISVYKNYPRLVGECGGKNFHFVHSSADVATVVACTIRSAFEYGGQKCSACSILYVPESLWDSQIKLSLIEKCAEISVGDVCSYESFFSAVIDENSYRRICSFLSYAKDHMECEIIAGGRSSSSKGYFIDPTIIVVKDLSNRLLDIEIFGPILCVYVYKDDEIDNIMSAISKSSYGLTASVFSHDPNFTRKAIETFKNNAGNFYINDKSTGAVVGQQPFGGSRLSGTNDKAGAPHYLLRWTSHQCIKETYVPVTDIFYEYMKQEES